MVPTRQSRPLDRAASRRVGGAAMASIIVPNKALAANPLKVSQTMGASLAFLGLDRCLALEHGAQGCTAFSKVFFTNHFREPIPLQTTAMDHVVTVVGADAQVMEGLRTVIDNHRPEVVGLVTTGLAELQGADIAGTLKEFRTAHPQYAQVRIVPVSAPDTVGCLETGFALAVEAMIDNLVPETRHAGRRSRQVNVLVSSALTPADVETVADWIAAFGLRAVMLPDLGNSLDGHLDQGGFETLTAGGALVSEIATMGESLATLVIGASLDKAADLLKVRTGVPDHRFPVLMGLDACDAFTGTLHTLSGMPVPRLVERKRARLLDAMVDCYSRFSGSKVGVAADPDLLAMLVRFFVDVGIGIDAAVAASRSDSLAELPVETVTIGDLADLEQNAAGADFLVANSHGGETARRLGIPLLRAGFPLYDRFGGFAKQWVGYTGSRQILFDAANLLAEHRPGIAPYRSIYWQGTAREHESRRFESSLQ